MRRLPNTYPGDTTKYPTGRGTIGIGSPNAGSKVLFYNETPVNLDLDFYNGSTDVLHAWEANFWILDGEVGDITWQIDADSLNVSNPPINAVFTTLYEPNESLGGKTYPMPLIRQLGQQAVTGGGGVIAAILQNIGNAPGTNVIQINSTSNANNSLTLTNDGLLDLLVTIGATLVQVLRTYEPAAGGTILQLGAATYLSELMGNLIVDGTLESSGAGKFDSTLESVGAFTADGTSTLKGAVTAAAVGVLTHLLGNLTVDGNSTHTGTTQLTGATTLSALLTLAAAGLTAPAATDVAINAVTGQKTDIQVNGVNELTIAGSDVRIPNGHLGKSATGDIIDASAGSTSPWYYKGAGGVGALINFQPESGVTSFSMTKTQFQLGSGTTYKFLTGTMSRQTGNGNIACGSGTTITHGLGATPALVLATPNIAQAGSATVGIGNVGSTTFQATVGAGTAVSFWCLAG